MQSALTARELLSRLTKQPLSGCVVEPENRRLECLLNSLFFLRSSQGMSALGDLRASRQFLRNARRDFGLHQPAPFVAVQIVRLASSPMQARKRCHQCVPRYA